MLLARDAPPASAAYRILLGDAPPGGAPALREPAATPLVAPWGGGGAPPAVVAADGARLLFRRDADGVTWIECDLARGSFAAAKYRGSSAAAAVREFLGANPSFIQSVPRALQHVQRPLVPLLAAVQAAHPKRQGGAHAADAARAPVGRRTPDAQL